MAAHEWIRSFDSGWRIQYDEYKSNKATRALAAQACDALGLQFGAVDIGRRADGSYLVLEVNRAPGIEGGTVERYATAIAGWVRGQ
jgi:glutathione synthase/RimK-type ligase-like ATP-grasp enzyme